MSIIAPTLLLFYATSVFWYPTTFLGSLPNYPEWTLLLFVFAVVNPWDLWRLYFMETLTEQSVSPQAYFPATRPHIPKKGLAVVFVNGTTVH